MFVCSPAYRRCSLARIFGEGVKTTNEFPEFVATKKRYWILDGVSSNGVASKKITFYGRAVQNAPNFHSSRENVSSLYDKSI